MKYKCEGCISECLVDVARLQSNLPPTGCLFPEEINQEITVVEWSEVDEGKQQKGVNMEVKEFFRLGREHCEKLNFNCIRCDLEKSCWLDGIFHEMEDSDIDTMIEVIAPDYNEPATVEQVKPKGDGMKTFKLATGNVVVLSKVSMVSTVDIFNDMNKTDNYYFAFYIDGEIMLSRYYKTREDAEKDRTGLINAIEERYGK
jgi:hypothetical protein